MQSCGTHYKMSTSIPTQSSAPGLDHTLSSTFQSGNITPFNNGRLYPDALVEEVKHFILGGYAGFQSAVNYITHAASGQEMVALEEVIVPRNRDSSAQYVTSSHREVGDTVEQRPHNHSNFESFPPEADDLEEARQSTPHEDHISDIVTITRSKRAWTLMSALIVGVLSLVVVPGLVVGILTGQIPWGIALAGATATIVSFFAGLYYHHNK